MAESGLSITRKRDDDTQGDAAVARSLRELDRDALVERVLELERALEEEQKRAEEPRLLAELRLHQDELEAQNHELRELYAALEASRRYAELYELAPIAYFTIRPNGLVADVNRRGAELLGREPADVVGEPFAAVARIDDAEPFRAHVRACLGSRAPVLGELRIAGPGGPIDVQASSVAVLDAAGAPVACRTALVDVTDRRRAERALARAHESERRMRARFEALDRASLAMSRAVLAATDRDVTPILRVVVEAAHDLVGVEYAALSLQRVPDDASSGFVASARSVELLEPMLDVARRVDAWMSSASVAMRGSDLCEHPVLVSAGAAPPPLRSFLAVPITRNGHRRGTLFLAGRLGTELTDIDERSIQMLAERAVVGLEIARLRQVEARERRRLELLARAVGAMTQTTDHRSTLTMMARAIVPTLADACRIDVMSEDGARFEAVAMHHAEPPALPALDAVPPLDGGPLFDALVAGQVESGGVDGGFGPGLSTHSYLAVPLRLAGRTIGALRLAALAPGRSFDAGHAQLAREIAHHAATVVERARLFDAAQEAVRARDDVLGVVAHDLRHPLSGIRLAAGALAEELQAQCESEVVRYVISVIDRSVEHAERLIEDLLDVTRIDAGRVRLERAALDARALVEHATQLLLPEARRAGVTLETDVPEGLPMMDADRTRLLQVLGNLIGNAVKFTPRGGVVRVTCEREVRALLFRVRDTGPGIREEHLPHVFDRFWQAERGGRKSVGLGLAIAQGLVRAHGGEIGVESRPGLGCTFRFTIPLARAKPLVVTAGEGSSRSSTG